MIILVEAGGRIIVALFTFFRVESHRLIVLVDRDKDRLDPLWFLRRVLPSPTEHIADAFIPVRLLLLLVGWFTFKTETDFGGATLKSERERLLLLLPLTSIMVNLTLLELN